MQLLQLRYFLALVETGNMTRTAEKLFVSTSSLSMSIARLEKALGTQLFTRTGRNINLNEAGRVFAENVRASLNILDYAVMQIKQKDTVSIVLDTPGLWSKTLLDYMASQPDVFINMRVMRPAEITPDLLRNEYDFWLSSSRAANAKQAGNDQLEARILSDNRVYLAVPDTHPLASRTSVSLAELRNETFLFPIRGYEFYDTCMGLCKMGGFNPEIVANCGFFVRMQMVSSGQGISFVNDQYKEIFKHIVIIDIDEASELQSNGITIIWHTQKEMSVESKNFLRYITWYYRE